MTAIIETSQYHSGINIITTLMVGQTKNTILDVKIRNYKEGIHITVFGKYAHLFEPICLSVISQIDDANKCDNLYIYFDEIRQKILLSKKIERFKTSMMGYVEFYPQKCS